jgi:hypothetical protein
MAAKIALRPVAELRPHAGNARVHSAEQLEQIKASMLAFGFTNPLLVDEANNLIAGHGRLEAALALGIDKVPVIVLRHLSVPQKEALRLADMFARRRDNPLGASTTRLAVNLIDEIVCRPLLGSAGADEAHAACECDDASPRLPAAARCPLRRAWSPPAGCCRPAAAIAPSARRRPRPAASGCRTPGTTWRTHRASSAAKPLAKELDTLPGNWLKCAAEAAAEITRQDHKAWKAAMP